TQVNQACWNFQPNSSYPGPICLKGPQMPRTGNIFVGQFLYTIPGFNQREYIQTQLTAPMTPGNIYYAEYYVSFADYHELYTDRLGAYFSDSPVNLPNDGPMLFNPQVMASGFISDSSGWVKISGSFMATAAYNYITIGNFYDDANTSTQVNPGGHSGPGCYGAYYFVDDVSVQESKTAITEYDSPTIHIFPNPFNENIKVQSNSGGPCEILLYDISGRLLMKENFINTVSINTIDLANGAYFCEVKNKEKILKHEKLIK
ncbi:MAG: T9SS type A sorting domain-containing protein, partial [Bacteroidota bacterium]